MPISEVDFAHVEDERFKRLLAFWLAARGDAALPGVQDIDPTRFSFLLEQVWLCAVEENPREFRYRLAGDHVRAAYDRPLIGLTLRELTPANVTARVLGYFDKVVDLPAVVHVAGRIYSEENTPARGERLILPFADPGTGTVTRILGATVHSWEARGIGIGNGDVPIRQVRTFTPVDGSQAWCESWL